jgi:hypothetical protein
MAMIDVMVTAACLLLLPYLLQLLPTTNLPPLSTYSTASTNAPSIFNAADACRRRCAAACRLPPTVIARDPVVVVARDRETREREGESAAVAVAMCNEIRVPTFSAHATINTTAERGVAVATGSDGPEANAGVSASVAAVPASEEGRQRR